MSVKNSIAIAAFAIFSLCLFVPTAAAQVVVSSGDLEVTFEQSPLFADMNIAPGFANTKTVMVKNIGSTTQTVYVAATSTSSTGLAEVMTLLLNAGATTHFNGTFDAFFDPDPIPLGTLAGGASRTYTFATQLPQSAGNTLQSTSMGFDLVVGFEGGPQVSDSTPGGGGSGSSFFVFNESVQNNNENAELSWETNREGTTYLVCGDLEDGPYTLDEDEPLFGYAFDVTEDASLTETHEVTLSGLPNGEYECVPASREDISDDFTFGDELRFVLRDGEVLGESATNINSGFTTPILSFLSEPLVPESRAVEDVAGASTSSASMFDRVQQASAEVFGDDALCLFIWLLLLLAISLSWSLYDDLLRHKDRAFARFFGRNLIFSLAYLLFLAGAYLLGLLEMLWWVFAFAWIAAVSFDYVLHRYGAFIWSARTRNLYFAGTSLVLMLLGYFTEIICAWVPFLVILLVSVVLFFLDE